MLRLCRILRAEPRPAGFPYGKLRPVLACRPGANLPEERNQGRRRAELDPLVRDLRDLISAAGADVAEKARRERLLRPPGICGQSAPAGIGKVLPGASWSVFFRDGHQTMTLPIADLNRGGRKRRSASRVGSHVMPCVRFADSQSQNRRPDPDRSRKYSFFVPTAQCRCRL